MLISLHIEYQTQWGAQLYVTTGRKPEVGDMLPRNAIEMDNDGRGNWFVEVPADQLTATAYHYVLAYQRRVMRNEFGNGHRIAGLGDAHSEVPTLKVWDDWRRLPLYRSFFSLVFKAHPARTHEDAELPYDALLPNRLTMVCEAASIEPQHVLALIGNVPELGSWQPEQALVMKPIGQHLWGITIDRTQLRFPLRFKFVLLTRDTHQFVAWEDCTNRFFEPSAMEPGDSLLICNQRFKPVPSSTVRKLDTFSPNRE